MGDPEFYAKVYRRSWGEHEVTIFQGDKAIEWRSVFGARAARRVARRRIRRAIHNANPTIITLDEEHWNAGVPVTGATDVNGDDHDDDPGL